MDDLTARVTRLEQEARTWRIAALAVTTLALVGFGVTQVTAQGEAGKGTTVKAPFKVVDEKGETIMAASKIPTGNGLIVMHPDGTSLTIHSGATGAGIGCYRGNKQLATFGSTTEEGYVQLRTLSGAKLFEKP